jgi:hypothetical protein
MILVSLVALFGQTFVVMSAGPLDPLRTSERTPD